MPSAVCTIWVQATRSARSAWTSSPITCSPPGLDLALELRDAPEATLAQLERAHTARYVTQLRDLLERLRDSGEHRALDPDTVACPATWQAALRAAGAAVAATDAVLAGEVRNAFCAVRPPGHHATRDQAMGFCFFNNVAVAARHALDVHGLQRVAIIDFDVHHGNGTEDIIAGDDRVLMCSFFQHPLYPNSGAVPKGTNMVNVPVPPYTRGPEVRDLIDADVDAGTGGLQARRCCSSRPVSTPTAKTSSARWAWSRPTTGWITRRLVELADRHARGRIVSCLEGGYALAALARSVAVHLRVLAGV